MTRFGPIPTLRPESDPIWPGIGNFGAISTKLGSACSEVYRSWLGIDHTWPELAKFVRWPGIDQIWADFDQVRLRFDEVCTARGGASIIFPGLLLMQHRVCHVLRQAPFGLGMLICNFVNRASASQLHDGSKRLLLIHLVCVCVCTRMTLQAGMDCSVRTAFEVEEVCMCGQRVRACSACVRACRDHACCFPWRGRHRFAHGRLRQRLIGHRRRIHSNSTRSGSISSHSSTSDTCSIRRCGRRPAIMCSIVSATGSLGCAPGGPWFG